MVSIETYTMGIILLFSFVFFCLLFGLLTGGKRKNILKTEFWIIFGLSLILTISAFVLITSNIIPLSSIYDNSIFKSLFGLK